MGVDGAPATLELPALGMAGATVASALDTAWLAWAADGVSGVPHWLQKRAPGGLTAPQLGQTRGNGWPQLMQKRACSGFTVWHCGQI
ncbi:MAG TPA: hypothetical protein VMV29_12960, partial [Ktedonobacterales bacterium]|nr:hypothetical protein [Ktedonobacterales bacterium]